MTVQELYTLLIDDAKEYRIKAKASIKRNKHMNDLDGKIKFSQKDIDAILTDYINFVAARRCCDLALYTKDLKGD